MFWHFRFYSHHPAHPAAVHGDIEQGVLGGHFLRFAGGVVGRDQQSRRKRGVRDGGGHREDHATVNSALWRKKKKRDRNTSRCSDMKRSGNKKVKNLKRRLIMRAKVSFSFQSIPAWMQPCQSQMWFNTNSAAWLASVRVMAQTKPRGVNRRAAHLPWGNSTQGGACWSSSPWRGTVSGLWSQTHRGDGIRCEGCTLRGSTTNVRHSWNIYSQPSGSSFGQTKQPFGDQTTATHPVRSLGSQPDRKTEPPFVHFRSCRWH